MATLSEIAKSCLAARRAALVQGTSAEERLRLELIEIDAALARLREGTYGTCELCGNSIGRQRLLAVPEARLCLGCASGGTHRVAR